MQDVYFNFNFKQTLSASDYVCYTEITIHGRKYLFTLSFHLFHLGKRVMTFLDHLLTILNNPGKEESGAQSGVENKCLHQRYLPPLVEFFIMFVCDKASLFEPLHTGLVSHSQQ